MIRKNKAVFISFLLLFAIFFLQGCESQSQTPVTGNSKKGEFVILLHGLARTSQSMKKLEKSLSRQGYTVLNLEYPSTRYSIEFLSNTLLDRVVKDCLKQSPLKIHFVTHSMGGIVVRYYLAYHEVSNLGRVVMLSPPNQGSKLVDYVSKNVILKKIVGPAARQLSTDERGITQKLGPVNFELGVITGNRSYNPLYSMVIPGPDDGVVSVERAKVPGMKDFLVLPHSHTFIMRSQKAVDQVIYFLEHGKFKRETSIVKVVPEPSN